MYDDALEIILGLYEYVSDAEVLAFAYADEAAYGDWTQG